MKEQTKKMVEDVKERISNNPNILILHGYFRRVDGISIDGLCEDLAIQQLASELRARIDELENMPCAPIAFDKKTNRINQLTEQLKDLGEV